MWLDSRTLARARAALAVGVRQYLSDSNVQLVDLGYRIREREDGRLVEEPAVRFHVGEKLRGPRFEAFSAARPERVIPSSILSFPTDVIESRYSLHFVIGGTATKPRRM